jgi:hypothetical protein
MHRPRSSGLQNDRENSMIRNHLHSRLFATLAVVSLCSATATHAAVMNWGFTLAPEALGATGTGSATASFNDATNIFSYDVAFSGLSGNSTVAHFHCCTASPGTGTAGVAVAAPSLLNFPVGVKAGSFSGSYDLTLASSFSGSFITNVGGGTVPGALAAFLAGLNTGTAYLNIHSNVFPSGEIRGFAAKVPEPGTLALLGLGFTRRRKA